MEKLYSECPQCTGTGIESISSLVDDELVSEEITCRRCAGSTKVSNLSLSDDLITLLTDMKNSIDDLVEKIIE